MLKDIKKALIESYDSDTTKKQIGVIRRLFDTIMKLKEGGMSIEKIREVLLNQGVNITTNNLNVYLHRIKKERAKAAPTVIVAQQQLVESKPVPAPQIKEAKNSQNIQQNNDDKSEQKIIQKTTEKSDRVLTKDLISTVDERVKESNKFF